MQNMMRWIATLMTVSLIACHSPLAWSGEARRAPPTAPQQTSARSAAPATVGSSERSDQKLSEQRRAELAEREKANGNAEAYNGGAGVYIGGGVLLVALVVVLIIVVVD